MAKRNTSIYVDNELIELAKKSGLNISQFINNQLRNKLNLMPEGLNFDKKIDNIKDKQKLLETELQNLLNSKEQYDQKAPERKEEKSEKLKKEL